MMKLEWATRLAAAISFCGIAALSVVPVAEAANLVVNGDFSVGAPASGCSAGITSLSGWAVTNNVDIDSAVQPFPSCSGISPPVGTYFLDLTGSGAEYGVDDVGTITQSISTTVGQVYDLSFYFGGNPQWQYTSSQYLNDGSVKSMNALVNGGIDGTYSVNTLGAAVTNGQFVLENIYFTATSNSTTIAFQSLNGVGITSPSDFGPLLADVSVSPVLSLPASGCLLAG